MRPEPHRLFQLARDFAADLTRTVRAVAGSQCPEFIADTPQAAGLGAETVVLVVQQPPDGIQLHVRGEPLLTLTVEFRCSWDGHGRYLTVTKSTIRVHARDDLSKLPLLRFEYEKGMRAALPAAHLHVHGVHEALTEILAEGGDATRRSETRQRRAAGGDLPALSALHLPVGGHRFRPCLEDVLGTLMEEFGVSPVDGDRAGALETLAEGRERWRRTQVAASVRDAPDEAVRVLQDLGYEITLRDGHSAPEPQVERLRSL